MKRDPIRAWAAALFLAAAGRKIGGLDVVTRPSWLVTFVPWRT